MHSIFWHLQTYSEPSPYWGFSFLPKDFARLSIAWCIPRTHSFSPYTVEKVSNFPVPSQDSRLGRVWFVTSRLGTRKSIANFFLQCNSPSKQEFHSPWISSMICRVLYSKIRFDTNSTPCLLCRPRVKGETKRIQRVRGVVLGVVGDYEKWKENSHVTILYFLHVFGFVNFETFIYLREDEKN